ncbi:MAG: hypothetical protein IKW03_02675 [Clostridia bacterium]|nr:hypothetical protein [Clostridia bacterium]
MKIKNSVKSINPDISIILMCFGLLVACPVRIFQMLRNIDPVTGFYINYESILTLVLYVVLGAAALFILLLSFLSARIPAAVAPKGRRIPLAFSSFVFAATMLYDALSAYFLKSEATATIIQNAKSVSSLQHFHALFAFLSSCYFVVFFISYITGNEYHKKLKILSLAPLAWAVIRVLERITVIISIVRVSELLLELSALVFMMIFFMSFARIASDVNCKGSMWSLISCGMITSMIVLTYSIPRLMLVVTGNSDSLVNGYPLNFADIGCVLFILIFVITTLRKGYAVEDIERMNKELALEKEQVEKLNEAVNNVQVMAETRLAAEDTDVKISAVNKETEEQETAQTEE